MAYYQLEKRNAVFILTMINGAEDNALTIEVVRELNDYLDEVENYQGSAALVLTSSDPKTWCTGMNLKWFAQQKADVMAEFAPLLESTLVRIALLNLPTIACITGNCYGAGAIMACTFDFRLMREDRGRFCISAINQRMPISQTMIEAVKLLPSPHAAQELTLTGRAYGGIDCLPRNIVDAIYPQQILLDKAIELGEELAEKDRVTYTHLKRGLRKNLASWDKAKKGNKLAGPQ
ncbi:MAG: enoyl-CoA hydratase [Moraxellaceae bacterium]|nr:MAG: enoyl-CoA hydratase [Moraxellaceae bacterium]